MTLNDAAVRVDKGTLAMPETIDPVADVTAAIAANVSSVTIKFIVDEHSLNNMAIISICFHSPTNTVLCELSFIKHSNINCLSHIKILIMFLLVNSLNFDIISHEISIIVFRFINYLLD